MTPALSKGKMKLEAEPSPETDPLTKLGVSD